LVFVFHFVRVRRCFSSSPGCRMSFLFFFWFFLDDFSPTVPFFGAGLFFYPICSRVLRRSPPRPAAFWTPQVAPLLGGCVAYLFFVFLLFSFLVERWGFGCSGLSPLGLGFLEFCWGRLRSSCFFLWRHPGHCASGLLVHFFSPPPLGRLAFLKLRLGRSLPASLVEAH